MSPLNYEVKRWILDKDGIYKSKSPIVITDQFILKQASDIIGDYTQDKDRTEKLMILIDISELSDCDDSVLFMINHSIRDQLKSRLAFFGNNSKFNRIENSFYLTHPRAVNFKTFQTEQEALSWLKS